MMGRQPNSDFQPGDILLGKYTIEELLAKAPNKNVYLARARNFRVTVDVFSNDYLMPSGLTVSAWEAEVLGSLGTHPNIADEIEYDDDGDVAIMVTRYLSGGRLEDDISRSREFGGALTVQRILQISTEAADGLDYIHRHRILYLDLQPHNVLFDELGTTKLVDFDTAVSLDDHDTSGLSHSKVSAYTAPELIRGEKLDGRADLYSLGATIYEMCDYHPPFAGAREQVLAACLSGPPPLMREGLPAGLADLVFELLSPDPEKRPASAAEVMSRLNSLRTSHANFDRLLTSNVSTELRTSLETYLKLDGGTCVQSNRRRIFPDDHRYLMNAIMALAETDYRRAVIDAATATEIALMSAISSHLQKAGWSRRDSDKIARGARGLDGLFTLYCKLRASNGKTLISQSDLRFGLGTIRNDAAHTGKVPSAAKATHAVEIAHELINVIDPLQDI
jgi:serine/threonine protein kinase